MQYQCQVLVPVVGDPLREYSSASAGDNTTDMDVATDDLYVLTIGGVPAATALVTDTDGMKRWYLSHVCAHTRTGAGAMMIQYLQSAAAASGSRGIALSAFGPENVRLYAARGFQSDPEYTDGLEMSWDVN